MSNEKALSGRTMKMIIDIIILVLGIVLILAPNQSLSVITLILGVVLIGYGAISIIVNVSKGNKQGMVMPIISIALGVILLVFNKTFANTILPFVIGAWMLIMGIMNVSMAHKAGLSLANMILSIVAIVLGIIILIGVFVGHNAFGVLLGVCMVIYGVAEVINWISMGHVAKHQSL